MENPLIKGVVYKMGVPLIKFPVSFRKKVLLTHNTISYKNTRKLYDCSLKQH